MEYLAYLAPFLVFGALFVVAIIVGSFRKKKEQDRSDSLLGLAVQAGWRFAGDHDPTYHDQRNMFACFYTGHSRFAHNQMHGVLDVTTRQGNKLSLPFEAGDFHYLTTSRGGSSKQRRTDTYRFSYVLMKTPSAEGSLSVFARKWGRSKPSRKLRITGFGSSVSPVFEKRYQVASDDEEFARDFLHQQVVDYLAASNLHDLEIQDGWLCLTGGKKRWAADEFPIRLEWLGTLLGHWRVRTS